VYFFAKYFFLNTKMADYGDLNPLAASRGGSFTHKSVDITKINAGAEGGEMSHHGGGGWGAYGGHWIGGYLGWYWLLWVFIIPMIIFFILLVFPPSCILTTNAAGQPVLDLTRLFFISLFVGWFIVLIFWC
jgi:hypothetical protein